MYISMIGHFSNGVGWVDFYAMNLQKMQEIFDDELSFYLMNYFIISLIKRSISQNCVCEVLRVDFFDLQQLLPKMTEKDFKRSIRKLTKMGMIKAEKIRKTDFWNIELT